MDKENVAYTDNVNYHCLKKGNPSICNNMNELEDLMLREIHQVIERQIPHDSSNMRYLKLSNS